MTYIIHYTKSSYNKRVSYPQNYDCYAGCAIVNDIEDARAKVAELHEAGLPIRDIYNGAGRRVTKEVMA